MAKGWQCEATLHRPAGSAGDPAPYSGAESFTFVMLRLRDPDGVQGFGFTGRFLAPEVVHFLNRALPDALANAPDDPVSWLSKTHNPRAMGGVAIAALSALEIALGDIAAKRAGVSVAQLLGGRRTSAPVHVTCGFPELETDALVRICADEIEAGAGGVKVLIAARGRGVAEDLARLKAVRSAIGPDADLIADANCKMNTADAMAFVRGAHELNLAWLEEPVLGNDVQALKALAGEGITLGAGQMEQSADRFALLSDAGVDVIQPNAVFVGGLRTAVEVADAARQRGSTIAPAGGWDIINLHWVCGALETGAVELHRAQARIARLLIPDQLAIIDGRISIPEAPGLGLAPDKAALSACRIG